MPLEEYKKKRDFTSTSEPEGEVEPSKNKLKFVVQRHAATRLHYDFRLEFDGVLKSWAVPKGPSLNPDDKRLAMHVEDHPLSYGSFEGRIPDGNYGAGQVEIWDEGWFEPEEKIKGLSDNHAMLQQYTDGSLKFILYGNKLKGGFALVKIKNQKDENAWLLIKHKDQFATDHYDAEENTSPNSEVTAYLEEKRSKKKNKGKKEDENQKIKPFKNYAPALTASKKLNDFVQPMLASPAEKAFDLSLIHI